MKNPNHPVVGCRRLDLDRGLYLTSRAWVRALLKPVPERDRPRLLQHVGHGAYLHVGHRTRGNAVDGRLRAAVSRPEHTTDRGDPC
jgi:hypothetical protein